MQLICIDICGEFSRYFKKPQGLAVTEFPNDEVGMGFLLTLGSLGNVRTTTLKAFTESEFTEIVKKLP